MTKFTLTAALLAASIRIALAADPATLSIVVFDDGLPVPDTRVLVDGAERGRTDAYGSMRLELPAGSRELVLRAGDRDLLRLDLEFAEGEAAELIASLQPDGPARVQYESSQGGQAGAAVAPLSETPAGPPGVVTGRVVSSEGGAGVGNARIFVSGTPLDVRTDAEGNFSIELPAGSYSISVIAAEYDSRTFDGVAVVAGETLSRQIEITPAGLELPEFVVLEPFVEGSLASLVEERRDSASVADFLGAEQISRSGDSDAAGALKRVTGLTLVDGKYVYVRGLGERYSSVLLNGASIPSPDPTRRVVPLDLFPTDVIQSILVQKTYSGEMPGEFGGGTIALRTRGAPEALLAKVGVSLGYLDGTTGADGLTYAGGSRDWTGYDNGRGPRGAFAQALGAGLPIAQPNFTVPELNDIARGLVQGEVYTPFAKTIEANHGFGASLGDAWDVGGANVGFLAALRYSNAWDSSEEIRRVYRASNSGLTVRNDLVADVTEQNIELSGFLNLSASFGEDHELRTTTLLARLTDDETQVTRGLQDSQRVIDTRLLWEENQLRSNQIGGSHAFPAWGGLQVDWIYTLAEASRYSPNTREYRYNLVGETLVPTFAGRATQRFDDLVDDNESFGVDLRAPLPAFSTGVSIDVVGGGSVLDRERDNDTRAFSLSTQGLPASVLQLPLEQILSPERVGNGVRFQETTLETDSYEASQSLDGLYLGIDADFSDRYRLAAGVRRESNRQRVAPTPLDGSAVDPRFIAELDEQVNLPYANLIWKATDAMQFRLGYSQTQSRPDFRELSNSSFIDPETDLITLGNPDLITTDINNYDLRWEYYFSASESLSAALFRKEFANPIERTLLTGGSAQQGRYLNADAATLDGIELDVYKQLGFVDRWPWVRPLRLDWIDWENVYVSANYAYIQSDVVLSLCGDTGAPTNCERPLQGQSPYVVNVQLGYIQPGGERDLSVLFNRFGERIAQVGVAGAPDIYEQPVNQLDLVYSQKLPAGLRLKVRLKNLLDAESSFTQEGLPTRQYKNGRELGLTLEWSY